MVTPGLPHNENCFERVDRLDRYFLNTSPWCSRHGDLSFVLETDVRTTDAKGRQGNADAKTLLVFVEKGVLGI